MNTANEIYRARIDKVIDYITNHLHLPVSLEELASVAHFSPFHFHRIFVAVTGETVHQFTSRLRNEKAARLLRFSQEPVDSIAVACGFSSGATLSRVFKQYFGVAPAAYRKGVAIQNSKICKELLPVTPYHCEMTAAELQERFPVTLQQLPERRIAYIRVTDAYREGVVLEAFQRLVEWSKQVDLFSTATFFGMSLDDPAVTPKEKYRYEACITVPATFAGEATAGIAFNVLPAGRYAGTIATGDLAWVAAGINYLFDHWLINSVYECVAAPGLEIFLDREQVCNWSHFNLALLVPVRPMQLRKKDN